MQELLTGGPEAPRPRSWPWARLATPLGLLAGRRRPGVMILLSILYLAIATAVMVWRRMIITEDYMLVLLVPIAVLSGRVVRFAADWVPFLAVLLAWEAMRGFADHAGFPVHTGNLRMDQTMFGGAVPTVVLQHWISGLGIAGFLNGATTIAYFLHFPVTAAAGVVLWMRNRARFLQYTTALLVMSFAAFAVFVVLPTAPPWWAADHGQFTGMWRIFRYTMPSQLSPLFSSLDPNPVAALPSMHSAYPFLAFLIMRRVWPRASLLMLAWSAVIWFSVVYLGEHYVIDVLVGMIWALGVWIVVERVLAPRLRPLQDGRAAADRGAPEGSLRPILLDPEPVPV